MICLVVTEATIRTMIVKLGPSERTLAFKPNIHYINGKVIFIWIIVQVLMGMLSRYLQPKDDVGPNEHRLVRRIHRFSGYVFLLYAKANLFIGWSMFNKSIAIGLLVVGGITSYF